MAYLIKLNTALDLGLNAQDMEFFDHSGLTEDDLNDAIAEVRAQEATRFP